MPGNGFAVAAFTILTHEHLTVFSVYLQHKFSAFRTFCTSHIIVAEGSVGRFDLGNQLFCIILYFIHKLFVRLRSFGYSLKA